MKEKSPVRFKLIHEKENKRIAQDQRSSDNICTTQAKNLNLKKVLLKVQVELTEIRISQLQSVNFYHLNDLNMYFKLFLD